MLPVLAALMTGYALGRLIPRGPLAYLLCLPASPLVHLLTSFLFHGVAMPAIGVLAITSILKLPLLMLGVFLARRNTARNTFGA